MKNSGFHRFLIYTQPCYWKQKKAFPKLCTQQFPPFSVQWLHFSFGQPMQMCTYIGYTQHVHTRTLVLGKHMIDHAHAVQLSSRAAVSPAAPSWQSREVTRQHPGNQSSRLFPQTSALNIFLLPSTRAYLLPTRILFLSHCSSPPNPLPSPTNPERWEQVCLGKPCERKCVCNGSDPLKYFSFLPHRAPLV